MKNNMRKIIISLMVFAFTIATGYSAMATWTPPGSTPPGGNVEAPINISSVGQSKSGALGVQGLFQAGALALFNRPGSGGVVGIGPAFSLSPLVFPTNTLDLSGSMRFRTPVSYNEASESQNGIIYFNGTNFRCRVGGSWGNCVTGGSGGGSTTFLGLTDTPDSYTGLAGKFVRINAAATGLEFADAPGGTGDSLPTGTNMQTLRHNGSSWIANSFLTNSGSGVGIGSTATPFTPHSLNIHGSTVMASNSGLLLKFSTLPPQTPYETNFQYESGGTLGLNMFRSGNNFNFAFKGMLVDGPNGQPRGALFGIGTNDPKASLHISGATNDQNDGRIAQVGGIYVDTLPSISAGILLSSGGGTGTGVGFLGLGVVAQPGQNFIGSTIGDGSLTQRSNNSQRLVFSTNNQGIGNNGIPRITMMGHALGAANDESRSYGLIGINTLNPVTSMDIRGVSVIDPLGSEYMGDLGGIYIQANKEGQTGAESTKSAGILISTNGLVQTGGIYMGHVKQVGHGSSISQVRDSVIGVRNGTRRLIIATGGLVNNPSGMPADPQTPKLIINPSGDVVLGDGKALILRSGNSCVRVTYTGALPLQTQAVSCSGQL